MGTERSLTHRRTIQLKRSNRKSTGASKTKRSPKTFFLYRIHDRKLEDSARRHLGGRLIDIGCCEKPYQELLAPYVSEHVGVDHEGCLHDQTRVDLPGSAYDRPVEDALFDGALCTAVLEHLEEPEKAIRECSRVLKPGGIAIYSIPFIWHVHEEPIDFFRYSKFGIRYLFEKCGFTILELTPLSGFWFTFGQLLVHNLYRFNRGPLRWLRVIDGLGLIVQAIAYGMDRLDKTERWTWMYHLVATKRQPTPPAADEELR